MHPTQDVEVPQHPNHIIWVGVDGVIDKMLGARLGEEDEEEMSSQCRVE
jgi:hypothetical protein